MESLNTPRLPTTRHSLELGDGELCDGQLANAKLRTFLIDTPLDEALSDRERLWSFQQKHRGAVGKGNFLSNVIFENKFDRNAESSACQDKVEHTLPKIGIIEGEKINKPRRPMIVRPRLKTRYEFYIPHIHANLNDISGKFNPKRSQSCDDNVNQIQKNSEEIASRNIVNNSVHGVVGSRQSVTKCVQKHIKHGMHNGCGFCNNQERSLPERERSWTTLTTSDLKPTSMKSCENRRHYCSLTDLNSTEPQDLDSYKKQPLMEEDGYDTLRNIPHDGNNNKEQPDKRPKVDKVTTETKTSLLTETKMKLNKDSGLQTTKIHISRPKDYEELNKIEMGPRNSKQIILKKTERKRSAPEVIKQIIEKEKTVEEKGYSSDVEHESPRGKTVEEKMSSESKLETGNMKERKHDDGDFSESDSLTDLEDDDVSEVVKLSSSESIDRERKNKPYKSAPKNINHDTEAKRDDLTFFNYCLLDRVLSDLKFNTKGRPVSFRSISDLSMDWPKDRLGHTTHAIDRKANQRKGSWQYGNHPYRWTDKPVTENDKGWIEKILSRHTVIDETNYDSFARTKPAQLPKILDGNNKSRQIK